MTFSYFTSTFTFTNIKTSKSGLYDCTYIFERNSTQLKARTEILVVQKPKKFSVQTIQPTFTSMKNEKSLIPVASCSVKNAHPRPSLSWILLENEQKGLKNLFTQKSFTNKNKSDYQTVLYIFKNLTNIQTTTIQAKCEVYQAASNFRKSGKVFLENFSHRSPKLLLSGEELSCKGIGYPRPNLTSPSAIGGDLSA